MLLFHCFMILVLVSVLVFVWHFLEFSNISESVTRSVLCNCSCCGCWAMLNPQSSIIVVAQNTKPWLAINTWATKHKATRYMQQSRGFCAWKKYTTLTGHNRTCRKQSDFSVDHQHVFQYTRAMLDDLWRMSCVTNPHNTLPGPKYTRSKISLNWWAVTGWILFIGVPQSLAKSPTDFWWRMFSDLPTLSAILTESKWNIVELSHCVDSAPIEVVADVDEKIGFRLWRPLFQGIGHLHLPTSL